MVSTCPRTWKTEAEGFSNFKADRLHSEFKANLSYTRRPYVNARHPQKTQNPFQESGSVGEPLVSMLTL